AAHFTASDLHHFEVFLARAAFRAGPVHRHVFPARARREAFVRQTGSLIVDEAADETHPRLVCDLIFGHRRGRILTHVDVRAAGAADGPYVRCIRSHGWRGPAGGSAHARGARLPSALGADGAHGAGHEWHRAHAGARAGLDH